jgi:hypothetical protein
MIATSMFNMTIVKIIDDISMKILKVVSIGFTLGVKVEGAYWSS